MKFKNPLFALSLGLVCLGSTNAHALSPQEGFLYSAVGCTSLYKKLEKQDQANQLVNFIHKFSTEQGIETIQTGYMDRFIKVIEKEWEKDNGAVEGKCSGIFDLGKDAPKPAQYNAIAESVVEYMQDLDEIKKRNQNKIPTPQPED